MIGAPGALTAAPTEGLEILFLMHPSTTGGAFAATILTFFMNSRDITIAGLLLSVLAGGTAMLAVAADIAYLVVAKQKVNQLMVGEFKILWGNAVWMVSRVIGSSGYLMMRHQQLVGSLALWGAIFIIFANLYFGVR